MNIRHLAAAALTAVAVVVSGCSGPPEPPETSPTFATEDEAFAAAEATYRAYVDALNEVDLSDPATFEPVFALTTGNLNSSDKEGLSNYHAELVTIEGETRIELLEGEAFDTSDGGVTLAVCLDVSDVTLVNKDGESIVDVDRVPVQSLRVTVQPSSSESSPLRVSSVAGRDGEPLCE